MESTGWANFESFENTPSAENTENKKPHDELKEKMSDTTAANLTEKDSSFCEIVGDNERDKKSEDFIKNEPSEIDLSATKTDLNKSESNEEPIISAANENVNTKELPADRY